MIDSRDIPFLFIKKEPLYGSECGMRFRLAKVSSEEDGDYIDVCIWPEPYNYNKTDEALKTKERFEFSVKGTSDAVEWLNEQLVQREELWNSVYNKPLSSIM